MATTTPPDFTGSLLPFDPISYWVAGDYDPSVLLDALRDQPALADFEDENGNRQGAVRLDADADPTNVGYWVTVPAAASEADIKAAVKAYAPPPPPPPDDPLVPVSVAVNTAVAAALATVGITSPNLTTTQKASIESKVRAQVQAVVDAHLGAK